MKWRRLPMWGSLGVIVVAACLLGGNFGVAAEESPDDASNPYLAAAELSTAELVEFLDRMQRKPQTIRVRPGFSEALLDAADRVLAAQPPPKQETAALLIKFEVLTLHVAAGDDDASAELSRLAERYAGDERPKIADLARLCLLERRAATAEKLAENDVPALLDDVQTYVAGQTLSGRHLRLASNTIRAINMLSDLKRRSEYFDTFGKLFAKSADKKLAKYGRDIAQIKPEKKADLIGQTLEIEGPAVDGAPFDWSSYRGKVVLVDFWATWCGPCRAELPNVKQQYERYHERGFEIVAISLDQDRATLETFLAENEIPWVNLFDDQSGGWDNPNAARYGVKAIPAAWLVDRQGKVVSTSARGAELGRQLEMLLGK